MGKKVDKRTIEEVRKEVQRKWENLGFLDGLKGHIKEDIAKLYESGPATLLSDDSIIPKDYNGEGETDK
jgi:hypothetical protein